MLHSYRIAYLKSVLIKKVCSIVLCMNLQTSKLRILLKSYSNSWTISNNNYSTMMAAPKGMNSKHLAAGSQMPPPEPGLMRIYNMRFCPYAQRTVLALLAKGIQFEVVNVNLKSKPDWFLKRNPLGKVPTLEKDGQIVYESDICNDYLDDAGFGKRLSPTDPLQRAHQKMLTERLSKLPNTLHSLYRSSDAEEKIAAVSETLDLYEQLLYQQYYSGAECGNVDYMVWPWLERMGVVELLTNRKVKVDKVKRPKLSAYVARMLTRPEVQMYALDADTHLRFIGVILPETAIMGVEGINSKHYVTGDEFPPVTPGRLRVYAMRFCPFSERTMLAILAKGIHAEVINCNLKRKPAWLLEKNPLGSTPTLELDGVVVFDSAVCSEYLDDAGIGPRILPADPYLKAKQKMTVERLAGLFAGFVSFLFHKKSDEEAFEEVNVSLQKAENVLEQNFFAGDTCGWADHQVWPFFERILALEIMSEGKFKLDQESFPKLSAYIGRMQKQPEVQAWNMQPKYIAEFSKAYFSGEEPNYDLLVQQME